MSIKTGTVTASVILRKLAAYLRQKRIDVYTISRKYDRRPPTT
jgi:hypothetical protein